jgi:ethanolamine transporter EutH
VYRSADDGAHWTLGSENLPAHLQTDMLTRDPVDLATVYTGFAVSSHERLAQLAAQDSNMLGDITPGKLAGGIGVLAVALLAAVMAVRRLMRTHQAPRPVVPR